MPIPSPVARFAVAAAGLLLALSAHAEPATVITGVRVIDGNGGAPIDNATVVIEGERIALLGPGLRAKLPAGSKVLDWHGRTLIPGLISDHSHVGQVDGARSGTPDLYTRANVLRQLRQWQAYGVTTVTSLGVNNPAVFYPLRAELHAGKLDAADLYGADHGLGVPDGAPPAKMMQVGPGQLDRPATPEEARADVRAAAARHTDLVKLWLDDFNGSLPVKMPPEIYRAIIDEAHKQGLRVAAHVYYLEDARHLAEAGVDILAHGVRDQPVDDAFVALLKQRGTWYIPTLDLNEAAYVYAEQPAWMQSPFFRHSVQPALAVQFADPAWRDKVLHGKNYPIDKQALATNERNLLTLYRAGVKIGFGTDSGAMPLRIPGFAEHRELALMVQAGLTPTQALSIATRNAARLLKLDDRGVLAPGKLADFVVLDGDPGRDIGQADRIESVWHRGRQVSGPVEAFAP